MKKGLFITFEGGEGSGKSTVIQSVKELLERKGFEVVITREPGGVSLAEDIRELILYQEMDPMTEVLLFAAARKEHLNDVVIPALHEGKIVLCDRFVHSSYVYQGLVKKVGVDKVREVNELVIGDYYPDATVFLDLEAKVGLERIRANNRETNKMDDYDLTFHESVRVGYQAIFALEKKAKVIYVDASQTKELVRKQANWQVLEFAKAEKQKQVSHFVVEYEYPYLRAVHQSVIYVDTEKEALDLIFASDPEAMIRSIQKTTI